MFEIWEYICISVHITSLITNKVFIKPKLGYSSRGLLYVNIINKNQYTQGMKLYSV